MGQYYHPTNIDKMEYLYSHNFDNGAKLMEHSYIGNDFVDSVERLLSPGGAWYKCRLVWAGDYMDTGLFLSVSTLDFTEGKDLNLHKYVEVYGQNVLPDSEKLAMIENYTFRQKTAKTVVNNWLKTLPTKGRYLVNHTKKVCLDLTKEKGSGETFVKGKPIVIHPLPLLTCSGNGQGGGDYHGSDMGIVGSWAGDVISLEHSPMYTLNKPISFMEGDESEGKYKFKAEKTEVAKTVPVVPKISIDDLSEEERKIVELF